MASTVVALFDDFSAANAAVRELLDDGFSRSDISLVASDASGEYTRSLQTPGDAEASGAAEGASVGAGIGAVVGGLGGLLVGLGALAIPGIGPVVAAGPLAAALTALAGAGAGAVAGGVTGGLLGALVDMGIPRETAEYYAEGIRRGGHLVSVNSADEMTSRAVEILNRHHPVDMNERVGQWRQAGWSKFDPEAQPFKTTNETRTWPVEADRPANTDSLPERNPETGWDPSVGPQHTETDYRDRDYSPASETGMNYRTTGETGASSEYLPSRFEDFTVYDTDFRHHFETTAYATDYTYDQYRPAYRYGYDLAADDQYRDKDWDMIENDARSNWESRNPGTWERFKASVRHAWEELKDRVD